MRTHNSVRLLRSLLRERQRIWQMYFDNNGQVRITIQAGNTKAVLRDDVVFPHRIVEAYMAVLNRRIDDLLKAHMS